MQEKAANEGIGPTLRATARLAGIAGLAVAILPAQFLVAGPLFGSRDRLPSLMGRGLARLMGLKVRMRGADVVRGNAERAVVHAAAPHRSPLDIVLMLGRAPGAFVSADDVPVPRGIASALGMIFVKRGGEKDTYTPVEKGAFERAVNGGRDVLVWPEAQLTTDDFLPFNHEAVTFAFNNKALKRDVLVQGLVTRVTEVGGVHVRDEPSLRGMFAWPLSDTLGSAWRAMKAREIRVDIDVLPPMDPNDYGSAREFSGRLERDMRELAAGA